MIHNLLRSILFKLWKLLPISLCLVALKVSLRLCWKNPHSYADTLLSSSNIFEKPPTHDSKVSNQFCLNINFFYSWFPSDISFQKDSRQCSFFEYLLNTFSFTHLNGSHYSPAKYLISLECSLPRSCDLGNRQILQIQPLCAVQL